MKLKKKSTVFDINLKNGKSGLLCFVRAKYEFYVNNKLAIEEFHDIVYRDHIKEEKKLEDINSLPFSDTV